MDPYDHSRTAASAPEFLLQEALQTKCHSTAQQLLDAIPALTRRQAADCALLTLGWAPDLLEQILDKTSGPPFVWLRHELESASDPTAVLSLRGSLVMIAAALDDLPALNILLARGAHPNYDFHRDRWDIVGDLLMGEVTMGALNSPEYSLYQMAVSRPFPDDGSNELLSADPLSAAIFCNAKACAARLLEEPAVTVTPAVRCALARTPLNETQALVADHLTTPLAELLQPEDFGFSIDHPLLPEVLQRHDGKLPRKNLLTIIANFEFAADEESRNRQRDIFALMDADMLGDAVLEIWQQNPYHKDLLELADTFALPINRCRVSSHLHRDALLQLMEHFYITGHAPKDSLSGLACALLHQLEGNHSTKPISVEQLLCIPGAQRVLATESPHMLRAWLDTHPIIPASQTLPLLALLDIHKEIFYEL